MSRTESRSELSLNSFPATVTLTAQFDIYGFHPPAITDERVESPAYQTDDHRAEERGTESLHVQTVANPGSHHQQKSVNDKSEETEGENVDRQGKDDQNWPKKSIKNSTTKQSQRNATIISGLKSPVSSGFLQNPEDTGVLKPTENHNGIILN